MKRFISKTAVTIISALLIAILVIPTIAVKAEPEDIQENIEQLSELAELTQEDESSGDDDEEIQEELPEDEIAEENDTHYVTNEVNDEIIIGEYEAIPKEDIPTGESKVIPEGEYYISSALADVMVMDVFGGHVTSGINIHLYRVNGTNAQKFKVSYDANGYATIANVGSKKAVAIENTSRLQGANIWQYESKGTNDQKWILEQNGDGITIKSVYNNGYAIEVAGSGISNGTNIQLGKVNNSNNQKFYFQKERPKHHGSEIVPAGEYYINSALSEIMVVDIVGANTRSGINVQLYRSNGTNAQKFKVSYDSEGYAVITNVGSKKAIDVDSANAANFTNIWQYEPNGTDAQKWFIDKNSDGSITLRSTINLNYVMDVNSALVANGTNIHLYASNGTNAQKFYFTKEQPKHHGEDILPAGDYYIRSALTDFLVLDVYSASTKDCANVQIYASNGSKAQQFRVSYDKDGFATITNIGSKKVVDVSNANAANCSNVWQYSSNGTDAQKWMVKDNGDGSVTLLSALNPQFALDVANAYSLNGTNVQVYSSNGTDAQKWFFVKEPPTVKGEGPVPSGIYCLQSTLSLYKVVDVASASTSPGANVWMYLSNGSGAQQFYLGYEGDGYAIIKNVNSGKVLEVSGGSAYNRANIIQNTPTGSKAQKWTIEAVTPSICIIHSALNYDYVLDIADASTADGANLQLYQNNGSNAQRFIFTTSDLQAQSVAGAKLDQIGWDLYTAYKWAANFRYVSTTTNSSACYYANFGFINECGNCLNKAATFCYMARALGYQAYLVQGYVPLLAGGMGPHGWVEIYVNGTMYVCDPDFEYEAHRNGYLIQYGQSGTWRYTDGYRIN